MKETCVIKYVMMGREDGSWTIQAFDQYNRRIGIRIECRTQQEMWDKWHLLGGMQVLLNDEETQRIFQTNKAAV